jgi:hypothetical protein
MKGVLLLAFILSTNLLANDPGEYEKKTRVLYKIEPCLQGISLPKTTKTKGYVFEKYRYKLFENYQTYWVDGDKFQKGRSPASVKEPRQLGVYFLLRNKNCEVESIYINVCNRNPEIDCHYKEGDLLKENHQHLENLLNSIAFPKSKLRLRSKEPVW